MCIRDSPIIDRTTALHSAIGTLAALHERNLSGQGQSIDVCLADSGYSFTEIPITAYHGAGVEPRRGESSVAPSGTYPCKDGWVLITAGDQHHWPRVCRAMGKPEWLDDPRFTTRRERSKHTAVVQEVMRELLASMTMRETIAHFTHHDVVGEVGNGLLHGQGGEQLQHRLVYHRRMLTALAAGGKARVIQPLWFSQSAAYPRPVVLVASGN